MSSTWDSQTTQLQQSHSPQPTPLLNQSGPLTSAVSRTVSALGRPWTSNTLRPQVERVPGIFNSSASFQALTLGAGLPFDVSLDTWHVALTSQNFKLVQGSPSTCYNPLASNYEFLSVIICIYHLFHSYNPCNHQPNKLLLLLMKVCDMNLVG